MEHEQFDAMTDAMGGLSPLDAPIPGQSLTDSPDNRAPFEQPPQFVDEEEAVREIFLNLTDEDKVDDVLDVLRMGTPVEDLAETILFAGFREGKFTPDLMLLLIEPTIYLIMAIGEAAGIDYEIYPEEDFWGDDEERQMMDAEVGKLGSVLGGEGEEGQGMGRVETPKVSLENTPQSVSPSMLEKIQGMDFGKGKI